jgi:hypothetical protein
MLEPNKEPMANRFVQRHLRYGWCALCIFVVLGVGLESLHGFKIGWYLDVSQETRRLMLTLAHAHGALLALVNLGFASTVALLPTRRQRQRGTASFCLLTASIAMPTGFLLGGLFPFAGDPGIGIVLVPLGGLLLILSILLIIP